ncbi:hypothetical protein GP486_000880 [Trichoglossum hirsutum]|uniref:Uncharacterized protein n=1 Tax=Trichoglossum hirsutum TaxID=265104 RepID=A0A9P8LHQ3_9PEZI|nr:hypothetical protein GP486_000880 [Trichoglossum hirsutum]
MSVSRSQLLRSRAHAFCNAFLESTPPTQILDQFFTECPSITEHGPAWASDRLPFLGKTFTGRREQQSSQSPTCDDYFSLLGETLVFEPSKDTFPLEEGFIVDPSTKLAGESVGVGGAVSVVAHATFKSIKTGKSWKEQFIYRLSGFDREGRIGHWEIWADPLSAWVAVGEEQQ